MDRRTEGTGHVGPLSNPVQQFPQGNIHTKKIANVEDLIFLEASLTRNRGACRPEGPLAADGELAGNS